MPMDPLGNDAAGGRSAGALPAPPSAAAHRRSRASRRRPWVLLLVLYALAALAPLASDAAVSGTSPSTYSTDGSTTITIQGNGFSQIGTTGLTTISMTDSLSTATLYNATVCSPFPTHRARSWRRRAPSALQRSSPAPPCSKGRRLYPHCMSSAPPPPSLSSTLKTHSRSSQFNSATELAFTVPAGSGSVTWDVDGSTYTSSYSTPTITSIT